MPLPGSSHQAAPANPRQAEQKRSAASFADGAALPEKDWRECREGPYKCQYICKVVIDYSAYASAVWTDQALLVSLRSTQDEPAYRRDKRAP